MSKLKIDKVPLKTVYNTVYSIPEYQREFIWREKNQKNLIESILNDFPIGAILVYRNYGNDQVIDGLQRITTLQKFSENPKKIFKTAKSYTELEIVSAKIKTIKSNLKWISVDNYDKASKLIDSMYLEWFNSLDKKDSQNNLLKFFENKSVSKVCKLYNLDVDEVNELHMKFIETIDISYYLLPVMYYDGDDVDLPTIFENLNNNAVTLGKYDVYNAMWISILITYTDEQMIQLKEINNNRYIEISDSNKTEIERFKDSHGPIINIFRILHSDLKSIYEGKYEKKAPKSLYNFSFEIYSSLYSGNYNDIKSLISMLDKNNKLSESKIKRDSVANFFNKVNDIIKREFEFWIDQRENDMVEKKNRLLYLLVTSIYRKHDVDFVNINVRDRTDEEMQHIEITSFDIIEKEKWFIGENRQLSFFKEKCEEFFLNVNYNVNKKKTLNIDFDGIFYEANIQEADPKDIEYIFKDEPDICYFPLQDVNNEPYNKRIQSTTDMKKSLIEGKKLGSIYKISNEKYIKIIWKLSIEDKTNIINGKNYSLKLNLQDFQHVLEKQLTCYENKHMKYKAELTYVERINGDM